MPSLLPYLSAFFFFFFFFVSHRLRQNFIFLGEVITLQDVNFYHKKMNVEAKTLKQWYVFIYLFIYQLNSRPNNEKTTKDAYHERLSSSYVYTFQGDANVAKLASKFGKTMKAILKLYKFWFGNRTIRIRVVLLFGQIFKRREIKIWRQFA